MKTYKLRMRDEKMKTTKMKAEVVQVIRTETTEGKGTKESPICRMTRYWTLDGKLLSEELYMGEGVRPAKNSI